MFVNGLIDGKMRLEINSFLLTRILTNKVIQRIFVQITKHLIAPDHHDTIYYYMGVHTSQDVDLYLSLSKGLILFPWSHFVGFLESNKNGCFNVL